MSIVESEILMLPSTVITDDATNGGRMDNNASINSGVPNNVWPSVFKDERDDGSTKYRKTFFKVANDDDDTYFNTKLWLDIITVADDWMIFFAGSQTDTAGTDGAGITGTDAYGCGQLTSNVLSGVSSVTVTVEDTTLATGADAIFRDGDTIRITNKDSPSSGTGTEEIHVINGTPSVSGSEVTLTLTGTLANAYNTDDNTYGTRIMSVLEPGNIIGSQDNFVDTTAGDGVYDDSTYPPILDSIGTIEQVVTITFTDSANFTASSNVAGVTLSSGSKGSDYTPQNDDVSKPYFILEAAGFSGTWAAGDTIVFHTHPASTAIWQKRVVPALASSIAGNKTIVSISGEGV